ncbi:hypothetical protein MATR_09520 [Marivirga tractuosa]|uniref:DUF4340 domain-containing protein n=1 Tax=Marivirga tractuosa (strain ATCC 23168 / DSM 4126 / NBRC 15989 / NCIMB 1408 / VKM B-1430 / H-43) TaxID=643867 RepID=E4TMY8_MARTH|nr:hypothetical protein [Marivirga tractuosa]ADR21419.1 hypothetical protein Ftrac_1429 [Marivirga tractuosa DSM 4126]BDD14127.1 hypothetical protein MATR_09520 [Marivirga tractuosa]
MAKSQSKKNIVLLSVWIVLVLLTILAYSYNPYERKSTSFEKDLFAVENANQTISRIELNGQDFSNTLEKTGNSWSVNKEYLLDASMQQVFFKLLEQISIQRPIVGENSAKIKQNVLDSGVQVNIYGNEGLVNSYTVGGDFQAMRSYFVKGEEVYLIQLPGYQSYVAGIFEVPENDWRDRVVFDGIWQDMVSLKINRPNIETVEFKYDDRLMRIQNQQADTAEVMNFVERFNYFFVDQFLPEDHIALQKKESFDKAGTIEIAGLDKDKSLKLELFKNPEFNAYLVHINGKEWAAIRNERMEKIWIELEKL